jgi:hypothetical protein
MPGKHRSRICIFCGIVKTSGWSSHWAKSDHLLMEKHELVVGKLPISPWCINWFDYLTTELKEKYKTSSDREEL